MICYDTIKASVMNLHDDNPTGENDKKLRRIFENNGIDVNQGDAAALYLNIPREKTNILNKIFLFYF